MKVIAVENRIYMRHWFRWYYVIGGTAHKISFKRGKKGMKNKSTTVFNPNEVNNG